MQLGTVWHLLGNSAWKAMKCGVRVSNFMQEIMLSENFYKLRDKRTGLFREGGMWGKWTQRGKEFTTIGHIKQHLSQFPADKIKWDEWEVVEYEYTPKETGTILLKDLLK